MTRHIWSQWIAPALTPRPPDMTNDHTPADLARFVHPVPVGATIPAGTEWVNRIAPATFTGPFVLHSDFRPDPDTPRWTAEPVESPKPALPKTAGTVITCALDGTSGAVLVLDRDGDWSGVDAKGFCVSVYTSDAADITDWEVIHDPAAERSTEAGGS